MSAITVNHSYSGVRALSRRSQQRVFLAFLFGMDAVALSLSFALAYFLRFQSGIRLFEDSPASQDTHIVIMAVLLPCWLAVFAYGQLYNTHYLFASTQEYKKIFNVCSTMFTLVVVSTFLFPVVRVSRGWVVIAWVSAIVFVTLGRFLIRRVANFLRGMGWLTARTLVVGTDEEARSIVRQIASVKTAGVDVLGFVDVHLPVGTKVEGELAVLGSIDLLPEMVRTLGVEELIISPSGLPREDVLWVFQNFGHSEDVELRFSPGLFEIYTSGVQVKEIGYVSLVSMRKIRLDAIETMVKSINDYVLASVALLLLIPLFVMVGIAIKLDSPGPVFHRRRVLGRSGRRFDALKFRTMYINGNDIMERHPELKAELAANHKLKNDPRVTRVGSFLRKYSIDELPQLINVLLGQMSLVGPRMITPEELEKYGKWRLNLWTVKPGITGLWQISGRSDVSYAERVRLDLYYIRNYSAWFDLQILWRTVPVVLAGSGAY